MPPEQITIRDATIDDLDAINDIYNHYVRTSTATFQIEPLTPEQRLDWWRAHGDDFPVLVAQSDGAVLGWASLSSYSGRCAYRKTAEESIYLRPEACGRGLGARLLAATIKRARQAGFHSLIAIASADQDASLRVHTSAGFVEVGRFREVGYKFGRWLDVVLTQLML